jgi:hypothetical protein
MWDAHFAERVNLPFHSSSAIFAGFDTREEGNFFFGQKHNSPVTVNFAQKTLANFENGITINACY